MKRGGRDSTELSAFSVSIIQSYAVLPLDNRSIKSDLGASRTAEFLRVIVAWGLSPLGS